MKKLTLIIGAAIALSACEGQGNNTQYISKMEDTLFKALPTANRLTIKVGQELFDDKKLSVTVGDAELYNATEEERKEAVQKVADISLSVFPKDRWPEKGEVLFVENETSLEETDAKTYDMELGKRKASLQ